MFRHLRNTLRLFRIGYTLARHDALFPLEEAGISPLVTLLCKLVSRRRRARRGVRLSLALQALGPSFIKLGQSLSTRPDLVGDEVAADLAELRDNLPPFPTIEAKRIIEEDFGKPCTEIFAHFDATPVAAASMAQVHFATLKSGRDVAVKILRPTVAAEFARDLELFFWLADLAEAARPELRRLKPREVVQTFAHSVKIELDMRFEAGAARELKENMAADTDFYIPEIHLPLTSQRVLTLERIKGISLGQIDLLKQQNHDLLKLQKTLSESFFKQAFRDGFFHADLHPGNLIVMVDGRLAAVDFGIMGRISEQERLFIAEMLRGFLNEDYRRIAELHFDAGYVPAHQSVEQFTLACRAIGQPVAGKPLHEISAGRLLAQMFAVTEAFEMETQPQLLLLQKTMVMVEGVGRSLNPEMNIWQMAEPLIQDWAKQHLGPMAQAKLRLRELRQMAERLPATIKRADRWLQKLEEGGLPLHPATIEAYLSEYRRYHRQWLLLGWTALALLALLLLNLPLSP